MVEFGSYEVLETVAVGSTGTIYRARHRDIDRMAAIKELSAQLRAVPGLVQRFRAEAQMLASLDDEHIVAVFDFVEEPDRVWIAEEWVDGVTIAALLAAFGRLTAEQSLGVLRGALLGLAHAHDRNLVHRDFSPANILADRAGTSKLVDFGLAAPVGGTGVCGTPAYMSPEAARGAPVGKSSDVYSAAAVLFSLLSGRLPFPAPSAAAMLHAHLEQSPPALSGHGPAMAELVAQAMAKDPAARPPDARAFLARLEEAARQRYGADWLERASIAGLVSAAGAGAAAVVAVTSTAGAAGSAASAAQPAATAFVTAQAATGAAVTTARRASRFSRGGMIGAGVAVAAVVGIAIAATALSGNDPVKGKPDSVLAGQGPTTGGAASNAVSSPSTSPTIAPTLSELAPNGKYRITTVITSTNIPGEKVGPTGTRIWTMTFTCRARSCSGTVSSTSGRHFTATFDGTVLTAKYRDVFSGPCVYTDGAQKGQTVPGTLASVATSVTFTLTVSKTSTGPSPAAGVPVRFTGSGAGTQTTKVLKVPAGQTCIPRPVAHDKSTARVARVG